MTSLERLKLLLDIPEGDKTKDPLLTVLLEDARSYALSYCHTDTVLEGMMPVILRMAAEDYGRVGGEGVSFRTVSGASESYRDGYSAGVIVSLRGFRRPGGAVC